MKRRIIIITIILSLFLCINVNASLEDEVITLYYDIMNNYSFVRSEYLNEEEFNESYDYNSSFEEYLASAISSKVFSKKPEEKYDLDNYCIEYNIDVKKENNKYYYNVLITAYDAIEYQKVYEYKLENHYSSITISGIYLERTNIDLNVNEEYTIEPYYYDGNYLSTNKIDYFYAPISLTLNSKNIVFENNYIKFTKSGIYQLSIKALIGNVELTKNLCFFVETENFLEESIQNIKIKNVYYRDYYSDKKDKTIEILENLFSRNEINIPYGVFNTEYLVEDNSFEENNFYNINCSILLNNKQYSIEINNITKETHDTSFKIIENNNNYMHIYGDNDMKFYMENNYKMDYSDNIYELVKFESDGSLEYNYSSKEFTIIKKGKSSIIIKNKENNETFSINIDIDSIENIFNEFEDEIVIPMYSKIDDKYNLLIRSYIELMLIEKKSIKGVYFKNIDVNKKEIDLFSYETDNDKIIKYKFIDEINDSIYNQNDEIKALEILKEIDLDDWNCYYDNNLKNETMELSVEYLEKKYLKNYSDFSLQYLGLKGASGDGGLSNNQIFIGVEKNGIIYCAKVITMHIFDYNYFFVDVNNLNVTLPQNNYLYTGNQIIPNIYMNTNAKENEDYLITYENNVNPGKAKIILTGINNFFGTKEIEFNIVLPGENHLENKFRFSNINREINKIVFDNILDSKNEFDYENSIDISMDKDKSILAKIVNNVLYLQFKGKIVLNEDSSSLFDSLYFLEEIEGLKYVDTSKVTNMSGMFCNCEIIRKLDLSTFDTSNVTDMSGMFLGCGELEEVNLISFNTSKVTYMSFMFYVCNKLKEIDLSTFDTSNVTDMSGMFYGCNKLKEIDLSNFNTSNVTHMNFMFEGCSSLKTLDLSSFNTSNVIFMYYMFSMMHSLETIYVSEKWDVTNVDDTSDHVPKEVFYDCPNLIGGNGTRFDEEKNDKEYARIDRDNEPGYLTLAQKIIQNNNDTSNKNDKVIIQSITNTVEDIIDNFIVVSQNVVFKHLNKAKEVVENLILKTGDIIRIIFGNGKQEEYEISVKSDVNGDGEITPLDYVDIKNHIMERNEITGDCYLEAADANSDGEITPLDYIEIKLYIMGKE